MEQFSEPQTGGTWTSQTSGTTNRLRDVSFSDDNNGTAVGGGGIILHTTNGETTWIPQTSGTAQWLNGVSFSDANNGTAVGGLGTILHTTNGGVPVEITSFTATSNGSESNTKLWSTATETNNRGFSIKRKSVIIIRIFRNKFCTGFWNNHRN